MHWSTPNLVIGVLLFVAGYLLGRVSKVFDASRKAQAGWTPDNSISDTDIEAEIRANRTVEAIKLYRQRAGGGLKAAKQAVQAMARRIDAQH
jgi:ribosomal protein L7/L12